MKNTKDGIGEIPIIELMEDIDATEYSIGFNLHDGEARVQFHNEFGVLSSFVTDSQGVYDFAQRLLRVYDQMEGL
jgi:hypothetical protein